MERKYEVNDSYFDNLDSEDKAYFLGLLLSDGYNDIKNGIVSIDLQEEDLPTLRLLNSALNITPRPIRCYENKYAVKPRHRVVVSSRKISERLEQLEMVKQKSYNLKFPQQVPENMLRHFIRGYFDGDGSIGQFGKIQSCEFSVVSTRSFFFLKCKKKYL